MHKFSVTIEISTQNPGFESEAYALNWIQHCLNNNTNHAQVNVEMITPTMERVDPRVLVTVSGGVAETYSDPGIDVAIFDWDNYNAEAVKTGGVPLRFEDLAVQASVPVEAEPSPAAHQPQG